ncbi:MAG: hypothetical protein AABW47_02730 [Nanoarchaeota archaeon]
MAKNLLKKLLNYRDAGAACANGGGFFAITYAIDLGVKALTGVNLNEYNFIQHGTTGLGAGTYAYRRIKAIVTENTGDERKGTAWGIAAGLIVGGALSLGWEYIENKAHVFEPKANPVLDTFLDHIALIGTSGGLAPAIELAIKPYLKRKCLEKGYL